MKEFKMIEFFLYNYENLGNMIKEIESEYIDLVNGSVNTWLKSQKREMNTLENQVINMTEDKRILRYKKWQAFLKQKLAFLYEQYPVLYEFIMLKYIKKKDIMYIKDKLSIDSKEIKSIRKKVICWLRKSAIDEGVIKKER